MVLTAIPFALAAAFFPAGLGVMVWLLATPPRLRRGLAYLSGAATSTVGSGFVILGLLHGVQDVAGYRAVIEGSVQVALGAGFVIFAAGLLARRPTLRRRDPHAPPPRLRARGYLGIFLLGVVMWTPSFAYLGAIDLIAGSGLPLVIQVFNLLAIDVIILLSVELPIMVYRFAPGSTTRSVEAVESLVRRYVWQLGSATAGMGGIFLLVRGYLELAG